MRNSIRSFIRDWWSRDISPEQCQLRLKEIHRTHVDLGTIKAIYAKCQEEFDLWCEQNADAFNDTLQIDDGDKS